MRYEHRLRACFLIASKRASVQTSDALVMLSNDRAQEVCQRTLHLKQVTVDHLNQASRLWSP